MRPRVSFIRLLAPLFLLPVLLPAATFDFESVVDSGTTALKQTVSGVTVTVTRSDGGTFTTSSTGGVTGDFLDSGNVVSSTETVTLAFSRAVNVTAITYWEAEDPVNTGGNYVLTPSSGTAEIVAENTIASFHTDLTPADWTGITSIVVSYSAGGNYFVGLDQIVFTVANDAPTTADLDGGTLAFTEDSGAQVLDQGAVASVSDSDSTDFDGGEVTISITGATANEDLSIVNQGSGAGQIGVSGTAVSYEGSGIGTITSDGQDGANLIVTFNTAAATPTAAAALIGAITYANDKQNPSGSRSVSFTVSDGDGGTSAAATVTVNLTGVNDNPGVTGLPASAAFTEDTQGNFDLAASAFSDVDSASITVTLSASAGTFTYAADGNVPAATLTGIASSTMTISGAPSTVDLYLDTPSNITYHPASNANGSPAATVTVTANDGDGSGEVPLGTINVNITAVNDAPTLTAGATLAAVNEDAASPAGATITSLIGANFSDVDSGSTFAGIAVAGDAANSGIEGKWQYSTDSGSTWFDVGAVSTSGTLLLGNGTLLRFLPLADFSGTPGSLTVYAVDDSAATTFTSGASRQTFDTTSDGATSKVAASGVSLGTSITAVNDAPTLTATGLDPTFAEGGSAVGLFGTVTASTVDSSQTFAAMTLTVTNVSDGASEILAIGGTDVLLTNGNSGALTAIGSFSVSVVAGTATVSVTGMTQDNTQMGALVDGISYRNTATPPGATARVITLTGIQDSGGTAAGGVDSAILALASTVSIDLASTVTGQTVPTDGTYKIGGNLDLTVTYSENVTVTGAPYIELTLDTGGTVNAAYNVGASTATTLTFRYTVASGNLDADGIAVAASITLNGGTIKDSANANAPTSGLGFSGTAAVLVDGVAPSVSSIDRQTPSGASTNAASVVYRVTFSEPVTGVDLADFALIKTGTANGTIASVGPVTGSETTVYDVVVNSVSGNGTLRLDLNNAGTGIADTATNAIATGYTAGQTYTIDTTVPTVSTIARQSPTTVNTDATSITYRVTFDGGVTGVDVSDFALVAPTGNTPASTATGTVASVSPVSTSVYDVVVNTIAGQGKARLDLKGTGTGIADLAGNALADGGFTTGGFYFVGATSVFDTLNLTLASTLVANLASPNKVAQRFTTGAAAPLTLTSVTTSIGIITGTPSPVVTINANNSGAPGSVVATLTNPSPLTANALNVWTGNVTLSPNTTYWIVFAELGTSYRVNVSTATTGGSGGWLTNPDYVLRYGSNAGFSLSGSVLLGIGATSVPAITSTLTASGTYGTAFAGYTITGTNEPTSFAATGLPTGLSLDAASGAISGTPTQAGVFSVSLTGTNGGGTGPASTWVLTIAKAPLTVTANDASRYVGYPHPTFTVSYSGFRNGDTAAALTTAPTASTTANDASPVGTYPITPLGGVSTNYEFTYVEGTLTVSNEPPPAKDSQTITFAVPADTILGQTVTLSASASSGLPVSFTVLGGSATLSGSTLTTTGVGLVTVRATQSGNGSYNAATPVERSFLVTVGAPPVVDTPTSVPAPAPGGEATLTVPQTSPNLTYQWQRNGENVPNGTGPSLTLPDVQPPTAGLYTYTATVPGGDSGLSEPVIVGLTTTEEVIGTAESVGESIQHPNGNVYDQVLLEGNGAAITAEPSKITRLSFIDLSDDIVQVEFSGAGTLSLVMDDASTPSPSANYNQPGVDYVRGHAGIVITGANETSNLSVISVGRITAVNQTLFRDDVAYDGAANVAFVAIQSTNGQFGGIRTGNVEYFASQGFTGVYAPGVTFNGPINLGDIQAHDSATPVLVVGSTDNMRICGGNLAQPNGQPLQVNGVTRVTMAPGQTSQGDPLPAQANQGVLQQDGVDVTDLIIGTN